MSYRMAGLCLAGVTGLWVSGATAAISVSSPSFESPDTSSFTNVATDWQRVSSRAAGVADETLNGVPDTPAGEQVALMDAREAGSRMWQNIGTTDALMDWTMSAIFAYRQTTFLPREWRFGLYLDTNNDNDPDTALAEADTPFALTGSYQLSSVTARAVPAGTTLYAQFSVPGTGESSIARQILFDAVEVTGAPPAAGAIPEPGAGLLVLAGLVSLARRRARH